MEDLKIRKPGGPIQELADKMNNLANEKNRDYQRKMEIVVAREQYERICEIDKKRLRGEKQSETEEVTTPKVNSKKLAEEIKKEVKSVNRDPER